MTNNILLLSLFLASIVIIALLSIHVSFVSLFTNAYSQALTIPKDYNKQQQVKVIEATGHFANNQVENGSVTWIQGGLWHLAIYNSTIGSSNDGNTNNNNNNNNAAKANFTANFTMVKPDGSLSHEHLIKNFASNNVVIAGGDLIVTGIADIYSNSDLKYKQVPITIHLMGNHHVLGVTIDTNKSDRHFASSNEMFGTLIYGTGLKAIEKSQQQQNGNSAMSMNMMNNMSSMSHG
jgi:DNA-binding protein YbaB